MLAQVLIGVSLGVAAYQDIKDRAVSDLVWIPSLAGTAYIIYSLYPGLYPELVKVGLVGGIALVFVLFGFVGEADGIAMAVLAADPYYLSPIPALFATAVVALGHIGYEYANGNAKGGKVIPIEIFLKEQRWIPKAVITDGVRKEVDPDVNVARDEVERNQTPGSSVEVAYGVPTVAYLGIGYVAFIAYLLIFDPSSFFSLP